MAKNNKRLARRKLLSPTEVEHGDGSDGLSWLGTVTISANGTAPKSRVPTANACFAICFQLRMDNQARENRWTRVQKCYDGFPPNEYSVLIAKNMQGQSNVPFRQMTYIIDNQMSSFYDMITERNLAATITTKVGNPKEKEEWSQLISESFDRTLRDWKSFLYNVEQDLREMHIAGKGFEVAEDMSGWPTKSFHNSQVLVPDRTYADLSNLGELCIKRSYTPLEFWRKVTGGETDVAKAEKHATENGWNFWACVDAMRLRTMNYNTLWSPTEWFRQVASGSFNLSRIYNLRLELFELLVKEFDGSISKCSVLQNYGPILCGYANVPDSPYKSMTEDEYRDKTGFLYYKKDFVPKQDNTDYSGWDEVICPITDSVGSGLWHDIQGLGEKIFVQCRQYDINMNRILDAANINSSLWLKGNSSDATQKMKQMEWSPWMILPQDVNPLKVGVEVPIQTVVQAMQIYQADLYRGIGSYRISAPGQDGKERTKGEAELDAAEDAKLRGTQIKRYNSQQGQWYWMLYRRLVNTKAGGNGYELKQKFEAYLTANGVPKEAWEYKNIERIESNMLAGSGSASFKIMAGNAVTQLAGMVAATPGQEAAIQDTIAAYMGRQNVKLYRPDVPVQLPDEARVISFENATLDNPSVNVENARVHPTDNHIEHLKGHYSDMMVDMQQTDQMLQSGQVPKKDLIDRVLCLNNKGGHCAAHLQFLSKDPSKKDITKQLDKAFAQLQGEVKGLEKNISNIQEEQQGQQGQSPEDIKVQSLAAQSAIKVDTQQKLANIKLASKAQDHQLKQDQMVQSGATKLALERAKVETQIQLDKEKTAREVTQNTTEHIQDLIQSQEQHNLELKQQKQTQSEADSNAE